MSLTSAPDSNLITAAGTHPGETGKNNEDRFAVLFFRAPGGEPVTVGLVCDGVGGHSAGEVASDMAVRLISEQIARGAGDYPAVFTQAVAAASAQIAELAEANLQQRGMATTCAIALVHGRRLYTAYVGDSRLYLYRRASGRLRQISVDHTWLQAAVEHGLIRPEEMASHPNQHVLLRHLGGKTDAQADLRIKLTETETPAESEANQGLRLEAGDTVLLCSDGLSDLVRADEIEQALAGALLQPAVDGLIDLARQRGGFDNITIVVMRVPGA
ncbi:MAG: serine/threonine-protein phosphatase [Anaerolineales bacterium]|nr:serine/threonine-protein phosphatase [Anaerolineales bacterium]